MPCVPIELHDTDVDELRTRRVKLRPRTGTPRPEAARTAMLRRGPVLAGAPIGAEEAMKAGSLSRVRVREALVKVQHSLATEDVDRDGPRPKTFVVPEVRVAWLRSTDRTQRILRYGPDGFVVRGTADGGPNVVNATVRDPAISVGIEGLIFSVAVKPGESALSTLDRLVVRLESFYEIEISDRREHVAVARLVAAR